ncbi:MAG: peptidoglycan-binding protein [Candidatus Niyogibacteria bacterium]|nr:peptidoglycan-binding protein [Candidatus Niyogibacteria bacterium]
MKKKIFLGAICVFAITGVTVSFSFAQTTSTSSQQALINQLKQQVDELQAKIIQLQAQIKNFGEVRREITTETRDIRTTVRLFRQLREGMTGDDIKQVQEILATDPSIYPQGLVTGFFGSLTKSAVMRFQHRFGIQQVGEVGSTTRTTLEEIIKSGAGQSGNVPPGLLTSFNERIFATSTSATSTPDKIVVCHVPPGNSENRHTIRISEVAFNAHHSNHNDFRGSCDESEDGGVGANSRIIICHIPEGNLDAKHTIEVSLKAFNAFHKDHGDTIGACSSD